MLAGPALVGGRLLVIFEGVLLFTEFVESVFSFSSRNLRRWANFAAISDIKSIGGAVVFRVVFVPLLFGKFNAGAGGGPLLKFVGKGSGGGGGAGVLLGFDIDEEFNGGAGGIVLEFLLFVEFSE